MKSAALMAVLILVVLIRVLLAQPKSSVASSTTEPRSLPPVTVEYIRKTALELSAEKWTARAYDVNEHCLKGVPELLPKSFVVGRTYYGVPYRWGGMDSLSVFRASLAKGLSAGEHTTTDRNTSRHQCTTGVDCSGLVSLAWGQHSDRDPVSPGTKYGTATLKRIADVKFDPGAQDNPNPNFNWTSDLHPGDAIITKSGGHVLLFDSYYRNPQSGQLGFCFFEAHGDVVDHHPLDFSDTEISGGVVLRYRNVVGPIPRALATSCGGEKIDSALTGIRTAQESD